VQKYLFDGNQVVSESFPKGNTDKMTSEGISVFVDGPKFVIRGLDCEKNTLGKMEEIAIKLSEFLPHTPTTAFGFNFLLNSTQVQSYASWFGTPDLESLTSGGYELEATVVKKAFKSNKHKCNISLTNKDELINIEVNYEYSIQTLIDLKQKLSPDDYYNLKEETESRLSELFNDEITGYGK
jgi:hypothetical protein